MSGVSSTDQICYITAYSMGPGISQEATAAVRRRAASYHAHGVATRYPSVVRDGPSMPRCLPGGRQSICTNVSPSRSVPKHASRADSPSWLSPHNLTLQHAASLSSICSPHSPAICCIARAVAATVAHEEGLVLISVVLLKPAPRGNSRCACALQPTTSGCHSPSDSHQVPGLIQTLTGKRWGRGRGLYFARDRKAVKVLNTAPLWRDPASIDRG